MKKRRFLRIMLNIFISVNAFTSVAVSAEVKKAQDLVSLNQRFVEVSYDLINGGRPKNAFVVVRESDVKPEYKTALIKAIDSFKYYINSKPSVAQDLAKYSEATGSNFKIEIFMDPVKGYVYPAIVEQGQTKILSAICAITPASSEIPKCGFKVESNYLADQLRGAVERAQIAYESDQLLKSLAQLNRQHKEQQGGITTDRHTKTNPPMHKMNPETLQKLQNQTNVTSEGVK